mgnify:CR=1 FL=1
MAVDAMHYADFCSQTQTEFLTMGCSDRRSSSSQCISRALDYASWCACDRRNCTDKSTIMKYSFIATTLSMSTFTLAYTIYGRLLKIIRSIQHTKQHTERNI